MSPVLVSSAIVYSSVCFPPDKMDQRDRDKSSLRRVTLAAPSRIISQADPHLMVMITTLIIILLGVNSDSLPGSV